MREEHTLVLYREIYKSVSDYVRRLTSDPYLIEEVTQEVVIKVHESLSTLKDSEKLTSWLKRIAYTTLVDHHRKSQKQFLVQPHTAEPVNEGNESMMECIAMLLKLLPDEQRELLEAVELHGMSQTVYANEKKLHISTVKSRVQRARQKLKEQITGNCFLTTDSYGNVVDFIRPREIN
ncbi:sigma-70 family RNA polymerase sigma factor [Dyadobacter diqingensis]|uniref:sigma-70 family RNA polymerase sigma factor n=1 Tax=Dyadobacter diqingensis TaxID=2938121 RepID=UPI0020C1AAAE|nr:sigma-70 family RNA polymerase sigma factor [Dyadobacter diqingensis]